jgi:hypothetical protein
VEKNKISSCDNHIYGVDAKGKFGVNMYIYIYTFHNKKWKALDFDVSMSRMDKLLSEEAICNVGSIVCCSFNCCQYFLHEKNFIGDKGVLENVL